jgi:hypothetical protein
MMIRLAMIVLLVGAVLLGAVSALGHPWLLLPAGAMLLMGLGVRLMLRDNTRPK